MEWRQARLWSKWHDGESNAAKRTHDHDNERRRAPNGEKNKAGKRNREIAARFHGTGPDRAVKSCPQESNNGCVDPSHSGLR